MKHSEFLLLIATGLADLENHYGSALSAEDRETTNGFQIKIIDRSDYPPRDVSLWMDLDEFRSWCTGFKMGWIRAKLAECDDRLIDLGIVKTAILKDQA